MRTLAFIFTLIAGTAFGHDYKVADISVAHPISYPTTGKTGVGYMMISNIGAADKLIGVEAEFPRVMIHNTIVEDGVAKMRHQMAVDIPTDGMIEFKPAGLHIMFMGLDDHWKVGKEVPATLIFENAGRLDVVFKVEARPKVSKEMDHSNHSN